MMKSDKIVLNTNGGVPYKWEYEIADESIVKFYDEKAVEVNPGFDGGAIKMNYYFKGLKKGKTIITFKYVNFVDGRIDKTVKYEVKVNNFLRVSIREIERENEY